MVLVQRAATTVVAEFIVMPLLTELVLSEVGVCYRHGAPNGAGPKSALTIPRRTAKDQFIL